MSLVVAMPMQLVNTSRAECELTNRLEQDAWILNETKSSLVGRYTE